VSSSHAPSHIGSHHEADCIANIHTRESAESSSAKLELGHSAIANGLDTNNFI